MAEDTKDVTEEEGVPKKGKGMMIIAIVGVVLVVAGVGTGLVLGKQSTPDVPEVKKKSEVPTTIMFKDLYVNIAETKATRILKLTVVLELSEEKLTATMEAYRPIVRDLISESASHMTIEELEGRNGRGILKREIKNRTNDLLRDRMSGAVVEVFFSDFLIQ